MDQQKLKIIMLSVRVLSLAQYKKLLYLYTVNKKLLQKFKTLGGRADTNQELKIIEELEQGSTLLGMIGIDNPVKAGVSDTLQQV